MFMLHTTAEVSSSLVRTALPKRIRPALLQRCGDHRCPSSGCHRDAEEVGGLARMHAPPIVGEVVRENGLPLDQAAQAFFHRQGFGHDFSRVRVHTGDRAAASAEAVHAAAYTVGQNVVFAAGRYAPETPAGRRLLAHELTHVAQQSGVATASPSAPLYLGELSDHLELEADRVAATAGTGVRLSPHLEAAGPTIQREDKDAGVKPAAPVPWTVADLKKMLAGCDGGLGIWAKAKKANRDKEPGVVLGGGGQTVMSTGEITLDRTVDKCFACQQLVQELSNLSRKADFDTLAASALAGDVDRETYIKRTEKIEYETGVQNVLTAFDSCKDKWGCKTTPKEWARTAKGFDDYYEKRLSPVHKENYGKWWDRACKAAYDKKHAKK